MTTDNTLYRVLGMMSGTSLDGLDIAYCEFHMKDTLWSFAVPYAQTYPYDDSWQRTLSELPLKDSYAYVKTDLAYGQYIGKLATSFIKEYNITPFLIASHGHTVFHVPHLHITSQIGCGAHIAAETGKIVVSNFRALDVALGGQGAPLVPIGDRMLFSSYDFCLNLGGFANISYEKSGQRHAFDICPFNIILNSLFQKAQPENQDGYDDKGAYARQGCLHKPLLEKLNGIDYYHIEGPKSLGREWLEDNFTPILDNFQEVHLQDKLRTIAEHQAFQISKILKENKNKGTVLVTGGGAYNSFIIELIREMCPSHVICVPEKEIVEFKEALIFAFLGLLRYLDLPNSLGSVTGAKRNSICGAIYNGKNF